MRHAQEINKSRHQQCLCMRISASKKPNAHHLWQGRNQLFIPGGNFHEFSFDDAIVIIQPWYNFFVNGHR